MSILNLKLREIHHPDDMQMRASTGSYSQGTDKECIEQYAEAMKEGAKFPPLECIELTKKHGEIKSGSIVLVSGFQRYYAAIHAGIDNFDCEVRQGTWEDARKRAFIANATHGKKRTVKDLHRVLTEIHKDYPNLKQSDVAKLAGCTQQTVANFRQRLKEAEQPKAAPAPSTKANKTPAPTPAPAPTPVVAAPANAEPVAEQDWTYHSDEGYSPEELSPIESESIQSFPIDDDGDNPSEIDSETVDPTDSDLDDLLEAVVESEPETLPDELIGSGHPLGTQQGLADLRRDTKHYLSKLGLLREFIASMKGIKSTVVGGQLMADTQVIDPLHEIIDHIENNLPYYVVPSEYLPKLTFDTIRRRGWACKAEEPRIQNVIAHCIKVLKG